MSVRRLADAAVQPAAFACDKANSAWAKAQIKKYPKGREQSAVIPLMMRAQEQEGWVTKAAIEHIADITSRFIVNRAALKTQPERVGRWIDRFREVARVAA